ncbi:MAG: anti-sigma factor antagonist, partial [Candidatus Latescibacterota bacterium]
RLAENLAERSKALLLEPDAYSVEQTSLTAYITRVLEGNDELDYVRVVDSEGIVLSSANIDEIFEPYQSPGGELLLREGDNVIWTRYETGDQSVRDIEITVRMRNEDAGQDLTLGTVHLGVLEHVVAQNIRDPRFLTTLILIVFFLIGVLLIAALVSVFVKPIQVLTDGVRAIGQGSLDGKISVEGPAEIGAIASVFNEITEKFKTAQEGVLEREKLQKEIEVAKQIQHALLPRRHPAISGYDIAPYYQAAKEVGGDYYDFVQVDDDTLGVVVADVSGKGVPGSLVMTMIRTALRMEARGNKNASDVMSKMNDFVTDDMKKGMFVTMFYVILDSKNRIISYASAGHNPMILYRYESNETYFLNPKGFPVGISLPDESLFRRAISLEKIKLKKDDMLVIYTDGVTEAMNDKREQYGEDRLIETIKKYGNLHPSEFIVKLERDIKGFTGGTAQNDDITVVAVKEKLTADDVLFGIRKKLIDMVEVGGMSVKEACAKMKVSPATFYRYKKRMETMGERGLRNKVLRQDVDLKRVSIEERKKLVEIIKAQPELGAKRISEEYNNANPDARPLTQRMVYDELKRLGLNTKDLRIEYLKRHQMYEEDAEAARRSSREMVEELLKEVSAEAPEPERDFADELLPDDVAPAEPAAPDFTDDVVVDRGVDDDLFVTADYGDVAGDLEMTVIEGEDDLAVLQVNGHLDSVSTGALEQKLNEVITGGALKIAVDLSDVTYISSGGWGIMVGEVKRLREQGGDVVLVGMTADVYDVYELLGFAEILGALPDIDAARTYFQKPIEERIAEPPSKPPPAPAIDVPEPSLDVQAEWDSLQIEATTVGEKGDTAVLSLTGIIDTVSAENLRSAIDKVILNGIFKIVVDMSLVEYVSSGGWGTFTERLREVRRQGGDIKLFGMDPDVYYIFTMLGFNIVLSSFDILTDAIEDFKRAVDGQPSAHPQQPAAASEPTGDADAMLSELTGEIGIADSVDTSAAEGLFEPAEPVAPEDTEVVEPRASADTKSFDISELEPAAPSAPPDDSGPDAPDISLPPDVQDFVEYGGPVVPDTPGVSETPVDSRTEETGADVGARALEETQPMDDVAAPHRPLSLRPVTESGDSAEWEEADGVLVGTIKGPIEAVAVSRLDDEIKSKFESKPRFVLFDLRAVDYISSTGWGLVAKYYDQVNGWGGVVALCGMNQDLFEIFSFLEFHSFIQTYMTRDDALAAYETQRVVIDHDTAVAPSSDSTAPSEIGEPTGEAIGDMLAGTPDT